MLRDAINANDIENVERLVTPINVNSSLALQRGCTPLHYCSMVPEENVEAARVLLRAGAHANIFNDEGNTPLHLAIIHRANNVANVLLKEGLASPSLSNKSGESPLHLLIAAHPDNTEMIRLLIECKCDPTIKNEECVTPLHLAAQDSASLDAVKVLIELKADVNIPDWRGKTPLHYAVQEHDGMARSMDIVKFLLHNGAYHGTIDHKYRTPYDIAENTEIRDVLAEVEKTTLKLWQKTKVAEKVAAE